MSKRKDNDSQAELFSPHEMRKETLVERVKREAEENHQKRIEKVRKEWAENPKKKAAFLKKLQKKNHKALQRGVERGWWDLTEKGVPVSPAKRFKISDFPENAVMGHVMAAAGIFPSISQARKNGWGDPIQPGEWIVTKKKIRIVVEK